MPKKNSTGSKSKKKVTPHAMQDKKVRNTGAGSRTPAWRVRNMYLRRTRKSLGLDPETGIFPDRPRFPNYKKKPRVGGR